MNLSSMHDVVLPVEADVLEGDLAELPHRVGLSGRDDVVAGLVLLEHQPHRLDVVAGEAPVALGVEVAEPQLGRLPSLICAAVWLIFRGHELQPPAGRVVGDDEADAGGVALRVSVARSHIQPR